MGTHTTFCGAHLTHLADFFQNPTSGMGTNSYRMPEEVPEREAYFCKYDDAYNWLAMYALTTPR
jgi:hypothetical protein